MHPLNNWTEDTEETEETEGTEAIASVSSVLMDGGGEPAPV